MIQHAGLKLIGADYDLCRHRSSTSVGYRRREIYCVIISGCVCLVDRFRCIAVWSIYLSRSLRVLV